MIASRFFKPPGSLPDGSPPPAPLRLSVRRAVRFHEVDPLGVMWHGHYASYFEDARIAFGDYYGLGYQKMFDAGVVAPIKEMRVDYAAPLRFGQEYLVFALLFWNDASRLNFEYAISGRGGGVRTRACTVQLFLNKAGELYYAKPDLYEEFCLQWKQGTLPPPPPEPFPA